MVAIKACKECGNPVSDKAEACPKCGAKQRKKTSLFVKILAWFFGITILLAVIGSFSNSEKQATNSNQTVKDNIENSGKTVAAPVETNNWIYQDNRDELHDSITKIAATESLNSANFGFPYGSASKLNLVVRKNHDGVDVYINISEGQFICGIIDGCEVAFKFDDGKIMNITMVESDSHSSDLLFIKLDSTENKIIEKLKTSKKLIIQPKFYKHGDVPFTFDVSGYKPI